jgi:hypothetical protein
MMFSVNPQPSMGWIFVCIFLPLKEKMVPGTYTQIYLQFVIAVKFREALLQPKYQEEVFPFISGLINSMGLVHDKKYKCLIFSKINHGKLD